MANNINLLPTELKTGKDVIRTSRAVTRFTIILGGIFLTIAVIGGGIIFFLGTRASDGKQKEEQLKTQIQSLEQTEQQLVLMKDRIQKTQTIFEQRSTYQTLKNYDAIFAKLPPDALVTGLEIDNEVSTLTVNARNSDDLATILGFFKDKSLYNRVELESLNFNVFSGYEIVLSIN